MLKLLSLVSFTSAALVEMGYPYTSNQADGSFTFNWVKKVPIKSFEWYSTARLIKYLKVTWSDGTVEFVGTDKTDGRQLNSVSGEDCFDYFQDTSQNQAVTTWNMRTAFGEEFNWELPFVGSIGRETYDFNGACAVGISGKFSGGYLKWVGYTYDSELKPTNVTGIIIGVLIPLLFIASIVACCCCGCCKCCCGGDDKDRVVVIAAPAQ